MLSLDETLLLVRCLSHHRNGTARLSFPPHTQWGTILWPSTLGGGDSLIDAMHCIKWPNGIYCTELKDWRPWHLWCFKCRGGQWVRHFLPMQEIEWILKAETIFFYIVAWNFAAKLWCWWQGWVSQIHSLGSFETPGNCSLVWLHPYCLGFTVPEGNTEKREKVLTPWVRTEGSRCDTMFRWDMYPPAWKLGVGSLQLHACTVLWADTDIYNGLGLL